MGKEEEREIFEKIISGLPKSAEISDKRFEGASIVLFSKNKTFFLGASDVVKDIAKTLKKRIDVRAESSLLMPLEEAEAAIRKLTPPEASITSIDFDANGGKVLIEAEKPGLIIGRVGSTLAQIKKMTCWTPEVFRTPPMKSDVISTIRHTLIQQSKDRSEFLNRVGKRVYYEGKPTSWIRFTALGGFREVGRSCLLLQTPESKILLDCGVNVANEDNAYPYLEVPEFDVSKLDAVVITHAHLDHSGLLPMLFKYGYNGPVYCTAPTRALMTLLQLDYIDVVQSEGRKCPYTSKEIRDEILHTVCLDYEEVTDVTPDIRITLYDAGHIIGSSLVHVHVGDGLHNLVYSGDIKYAKTRLLEPAWNRFPRCETLIIESTYGGVDNIQPPRADAEREIVTIIKKTIEQGGKVLIPVLGVGRSQELMLIMEELMRLGELPKVPIYLDGMMWHATAIYTTYPEFLSARVKKMIFSRDQNPFLSDIFHRVASAAERDNVIHGGPCIIMATSGMLTGGPSVTYLKALCDQPANGLIFINYQGEGSLGRRIQKGWKELQITTKDGKREAAKVNLGIHTVEGFSAHSDRLQLMKFVEEMQPLAGHVIINHGENSKCIDLTKSLHKAYRIETFAPKNLETVRIR